MGYSSKCSICTHKHAETINEMLLRRALGESNLTYDSIIDQVEKLGGPTVTACAISRHVSKHFDVAQAGRAKAAEQYEEATDRVAEKVVSDLMVLDRIRDIGLKMIEDGELKPDIKDVVSAINTKHKSVMKEQNPVEELINLIADTARGE